MVTGQRHESLLNEMQGVIHWSEKSYTVAETNRQDCRQFRQIGYDVHPSEDMGDYPLPLHLRRMAYGLGGDPFSSAWQITPYWFIKSTCILCFQSYGHCNVCILPRLYSGVPRKMEHSYYPQRVYWVQHKIHCPSLHVAGCKILGILLHWICVWVSTGSTLLAPDEIMDQR